MENPFIGKTSRTTAGWLFAMVFFGWVAFVIFVDPRPKPEPPPWVPPPTKPKLAAFGLAENSDWAELPEFFRLWQNEAEWIGDRTTFGYWSPGSADYGYVFEARRGKGGVKFRLINQPADYNPSLGPGEPTPAEHPLRFIRQLVPEVPPSPVEAPAPPVPSAPPPTRTKAAIEVSPIPITIPLDPAIKPLPAPDAAARKK
ncbi:MAG TPA: hypothetical protein VGM73_16705 [Candidatus Didemnitutus sp.]|jgi:hypothetical protein